MDEEKVDTTRCPLIVCFITEFLGTALFIFTGCMAYVSGTPPHGPLLPAFAFSFARMGIMQITVHLTPAFINPAVSLGMFILRKLDWKRLLVYWAAEYTGALGGYVLIMACSVEKFHPCHLVVNPDLSIIQGFAIEFITSVILMMTIAGAADERLFSDADSVSLRVGLVVTGLFFASEPYTGACMNPARSLPSCIFKGDWVDHWMYQIAPFTGMAFGALIYRYVFDHTHKYSVYNLFYKEEKES